MNKNAILLEKRNKRWLLKQLLYQIELTVDYMGRKQLLLIGNAQLAVQKWENHK
ncbi:hypothetical protein [Bacillus albus]|uniref:hypothetical protein n=1 Tax=Bacillus albus TaxID=2026189 RepID=UPI003D302254